MSNETPSLAKPITQQATLFERAKAFIPGGVNSPVRAFGGVGGTPVFFQRAEGAYLFDVEGKSYIDYVGSWGPMILGHAYPEVIQAVQKTATNSLSFGAPTALEVDLAEKICTLMPNIEQVRMVNSGTEATMSAIRLARGFTGRSKIIKFEGCYHGHSDALLVKAGSGGLTFGVPNSAGVPSSTVEHTLTATFNDLSSVEALFQQAGADIAAIIIEPIAGNMNCIPADPDFLMGLRTLCNENESLLIFDEVMTGFRVALGGAQALYGIKPDITTLGKVIGGGMPVGAFGGRKAIMEKLSPLGPVYQAGTLSGNPVAMAAGLATLNTISQPGFFETITKQCKQLTLGLSQIAKEKGIPFCTNQVGGMFGFFFSDEAPISQFAQVERCDGKRFRQFFHGMLEQGVYLAPSAFEAGFISNAHSDEIINKTLEAAAVVFDSLIN